MLAQLRNYWPDDRCAKAFWSQQEVRPYRRLLADTLDWCAPAAGEKWLDIGCGGGPLTRGIWERSGGAGGGGGGVGWAAAHERADSPPRAPTAALPAGPNPFGWPRLRRRP